MKKCKAIICMVMALTMIFCLNVPTFAADISVTTSPDDGLKQFIYEDFGVTLTSMLALEGLPMEEFTLLEPIQFNTAEVIENPNIVFPVADESGDIRYLYYVGNVNGYASSMSTAITPLLNKIKEQGSENVVLYQDMYDIYASVNGKVFMQQSDGSVESLANDKKSEFINTFSNLTLVPSVFTQNNEYTAIAQMSYTAIQIQEDIRNSAYVQPVKQLGTDRVGGYPKVDQNVNGESRGLCWAAATASMIRYEKPDEWGSITAQNIADFCNIGYDDGGPNEAVISALNHYLGTPYLPTEVLRSFTFSEIQTIIMNDDPAYMKIRYRQNIFTKHVHAIAVMGYTNVDPENPRIYIMDSNHTYGYNLCSQNEDGDWLFAYAQYPYVSCEGVRLFYS